ncbi:hypothetical protein StoSoilB20_39300 [Arthrobacter sp. StoSoilB20]|nr:hypothetical protein StoSoilB20_39300 [Arthrobacter sp. StoSoilB20]
MRVKALLMATGSAAGSWTGGSAHYWYSVHGSHLLSKVHDQPKTTTLEMQAQLAGLLPVESGDESDKKGVHKGGRGKR